MTLSNNSFYTSKTSCLSSSESSYQSSQNYPALSSILYDTMDMELYSSFPTTQYILNKKHVCHHLNIYLHFIIRGIEYILKQIEQVTSDDSILLVLMYKENFSQQAFDLDSIIWRFFSFSFPIFGSFICAGTQLLLILLQFCLEILKKYIYRFYNTLNKN